MNTNRYLASIALTALVAATGCDKRNESTPPATPISDRTRTSYPTRDADNTGRNKVDRSGDTKTPMDQSQSSSDVKITAGIRRAIMEDKSMSTNAQNSKIITEKSGVVTLRGAVNNQAEKDSIGTKAKSVAGVTRVDNLLEVVSAERQTIPSVNRTESVNPTPDADNTSRNTLDRTADTKTPMDQSQSGTDVKITADIRRAIMDDDSMSVNAQNCKIITDKSGLVTLRGVVDSQAEKDLVAAKAQAITGVTKVDNQLEVKTN